MKNWLEINITINGFTYAVRQEIEDIHNIRNIGYEISERLQDIINNREFVKKPFDIDNTIFTKENIPTFDFSSDKNLTTSYRKIF